MILDVQEIETKNNLRAFSTHDDFDVDDDDAIGFASMWVNCDKQCLHKCLQYKKAQKGIKQKCKRECCP